MLSMSTTRLSLVSGFVLIPKHGGSGLDLIEVIGVTYGGIKVRHIKTGAMVVLDGSIATKKLNSDWVSKEIYVKAKEMCKIEEYIDELKKL